MWFFIWISWICRLIYFIIWWNNNIQHIGKANERANEWVSEKENKEWIEWNGMGWIERVIFIFSHARVLFYWKRKVESLTKMNENWDCDFEKKFKKTGTQKIWNHQSGEVFFLSSVLQTTIIWDSSFDWASSSFFISSSVLILMIHELKDTSNY